jgi:hypothetical protein
MTVPEPSQPDLRIIVRRIAKDDPKNLLFEVSAAAPSLELNLKEFGPHQLDLTPEEYVRQLSEDLKYLILRTEEAQKNAAQRLIGKGGMLFEKLLPEGLRQLLWSLQGKVTSVQIISDDPHIPWELLRLQGREGRKVLQGPFLCEAFALTRWIRQVPDAQSLPVRRLALVIPRGSGLPAAGGERDDVLALRGRDREVTEIPALYRDVLAAMATGDYDAWHFGSHGGEIGSGDLNADLWPLELDDHPLTSEDLGTEAANLGQHFRPLVFFNSCNIGRSGRSLAGIGGWPAALLGVGAGAFIGALWHVQDSKARIFEQTFYRLFLSGTPIGEAVRQARLAIKDGNPTWLAYTVFAHPLATCSGTAVQPDTAPLVIPRKEWKPKLSPPGALLQAEYGIVPFHGRDKEMDDLRAWCRDESPIRTRLYTGAGGMGKTRLALKIAQETREDNWRAGFLRPEALSSPADAWKAVARTGGRVLVVVDYAETRRELLIPLLRGMAESEDGPYRLILLARAALDWWEQLKSDRDVGNILAGPATSRHSLAPLAFEVPQREHSYDLATTAFAERLERPRPDNRPDDLGAEYFERALLLHMRALIAVEGEEKAKGEDGVLDRILARERRFWTERTEAAKLSPTLVDGMGRAMAAITLGGGVTGEEEGVEVLRKLTFFEGQTGDVLTRTAHLLHECYPGNHWIEPILPDLLGEHLVQREMEKGADELLDLVLGPGAE